MNPPFLKMAYTLALGVAANHGTGTVDSFGLLMLWLVNALACLLLWLAGVRATSVALSGQLHAAATADICGLVIDWACRCVSQHVQSWVRILPQSLNPGPASPVGVSCTTLEVGGRACHPSLTLGKGESCLNPRDTRHLFPLPSLPLMEPCMPYGSGSMKLTVVPFVWDIISPAPHLSSPQSKASSTDSNHQTSLLGHSTQLPASFQIKPPELHPRGTRPKSLCTRPFSDLQVL